MMIDNHAVVDPQGLGGVQWLLNLRKGWVRETMCVFMETRVSKEITGVDPRRSIGRGLECVGKHVMRTRRRTDVVEEREACVIEKSRGGCADVGAIGDRKRREIEEKGRGHGDVGEVESRASEA